MFTASRTIPTPKLPPRNWDFCLVIEDCVAGFSEEVHEAAMRAMEYLQTGARRSLSDVLLAMEETDKPSDVAA